MPATQRHSEYFPFKPLLNVSASFRDSLLAQIVGENYKLFQSPIYSDSYLEFLVKTLKPFIDRNYKVNTQTDHTTIGGSSMGGLISLYALCEYPGIFGAAICMSTHWPGNFVLVNQDIPNAMLAYLRKNLPFDGKHKLYFDHGTEGIDSFYADTQWKVDALLLTKNFGINNYLSYHSKGLTTRKETGPEGFTTH
jgi:pimeloyl-ACP methyl ester carboxylesterase